MQVRNLKKLFDVTDVVDDVQGVVDDTVQRTTDNLHQVRTLRHGIFPSVPKDLAAQPGFLLAVTV